MKEVQNLYYGWHSMNTMRSMERGNGCKSTESQVKVHKTKEQMKKSLALPASAPPHLQWSDTAMFNQVTHIHIMYDLFGGYN